jgi:hypothetical protein
MRVFLPATTSVLRRLQADGGLGDGPFTAYAVTAGIRSWYADDDQDELEYAASGQAVRASLRMVDADPSASRRRVVLAVDVADGAVEGHDDLDRGAVRVDSAIGLSDIASIHIDDAEAEDTIAGAAAVVLEADLGLESAQERVDDAEGYELSWYAIQELPDVLASLDG